MKLSSGIQLVAAIIAIFAFFTGISSLRQCTTGERNELIEDEFERFEKGELIVDLETLKKLHRDTLRIGNIITKSNQMSSLVRVACDSGFREYAFKISEDVGNVFQKSSSRAYIVDSLIAVNKFDEAEKVASEIGNVFTQNSARKRINKARLLHANKKLSDAGEETELNSENAPTP
jgi:hypothetical protein